MVVIDLATRPIQKTVVVKQLETPQGLLTTIGEEGSKVIRAEKAVLLDMPQNCPVTFGQPN